MLPMNLYCLVISVHGLCYLGFINVAYASCLVISVHGLCYLGLIDVAYESLLLGDICTWSVLSGVH